MKIKTTAKIFNILIIALSFIVFLQAIFTVMQSLSRKQDSQFFKVNAQSELAIMEKDGLLNLLDKNVSFKPKDPIKMTGKEDFTAAFNGYFDSLTKNGGFTMKNNMIAIANADVVGVHFTVYQATSNFFEISEEGHVFHEKITMEVAGPDGKITGQGENYAIRTWNDGKTFKKQQTNSVSCEAKNGAYNLSANFDGCETAQSQVNGLQSVFPFVVSNETIDQIEIVENALSYNIKIRLNRLGYEDMAKETKQEMNALKDVEYEKFELTVTMDKSGNVVAIQRDECFWVTLKKMGVSVDSKTEFVGSYIIKKLKKEN